MGSQGPLLPELIYGGQGAASSRWGIPGPFGGVGAPPATNVWAPPALQGAWQAGWGAPLLGTEGARPAPAVWGRSGEAPHPTPRLWSALPPPPPPPPASCVWVSSLWHVPGGLCPAERAASPSSAALPLPVPLRSGLPALPVPGPCCASPARRLYISPCSSPPSSLAISARFPVSAFPWLCLSVCLSPSHRACVFLRPPCPFPCPSDSWCLVPASLFLLFSSSPW